MVTVLEEPPLHYGNTGNDCYLFVKRVLGIKIAQTTANLVKEVLKKKSTGLMSLDDEKQEEVQNADNNN
jgi:hypothetical protein